MFSGAKSQGSVKPTAMGTLTQASCYGATIPLIYGMTQTPLFAIWAANLRQQSSGKKFKGYFSGKKGQLAYAENIDFLIGHNPIIGVNQVWNNGALWPLRLEIKTLSVGRFGTGTFVLPDLPNDPFYSIIGMTMDISYSASFNDYGGNGPVSSSGTMPIPLWNVAETGPDPTNPNSFRKWPFFYSWKPENGSTFFIESAPTGAAPRLGDPGTNNVKVYCYYMVKGSPLVKNRLAFENELGNGDEFNDFPAQRIVYPMFAGLGSSEIDLGLTGALPSLKVEAKGKFGYYATGDADFADMIEDIVKSGIAQAAIGTSATNATYTALSHGLQGYNFPGPVQKKRWEIFEGVFTYDYDNPNVAGNTLVAVMYTVGAGSTPPPATFSDSNGNTWVVAASQTTSGSSVPGTWTVAYALNCNAGLNTVTIENQFFYNTRVELYEIAGVDSFDGVSISIGSNPTATLTTTNQRGFPGYVMAWSSQNNSGSYTAGMPNAQRWSTLVGEEAFTGQFIYYAQYRITKVGQTLSQDWYNRPSNSPDSFICLLAFKSTVPSTVSASVGDFIDQDSLQQVRLQCAAYGIYGSLTMTSQQSGLDWAKMLYTAANAVPVYLGWKLFSIPLAEQSAVGNGAIYTSPTSTGPVAVLSDLNGDFVTNGGKDLIKLVTSDPTEQENVLQMQCFSREANYNQTTVSRPVAAGITLFGTRKKDPIVIPAIQDTTIANSILGVLVRKNLLGGDVYSFTLMARYDWLSPMDLLNITDTQAGIFGHDVRLTTMAEQSDKSWRCEAEKFIYGMQSPTPITVLAPSPQGQSDPNQSAGNTNAPVIFEPPIRLCESGLPEIWIAVSSPSTLYGGCQVLLSTNGGTSYLPIGSLTGGATTGVSTGDWPASTDPDTTNDFPIDLTESLGELESYSATERDTFTYPCYVAGGGSSPIPYELMSYNTATLTAANKYTLKATGTGNKLRRGIFNCPLTAAGVDHPLASRFLFIDPSGQGILKITLPSQWIGTALKVKILSVNNQGGGIQDASTVPVYSYTPTGVALGSSLSNLTYTQSPTVALSQPTSTQIAMAAVTTTFPSNQVKYNARTFTIPAPSVDTWYYVTIQDPGYIGDTGTGTTLSSQCVTSSSFVGAVGYTFIGAILAKAAGGSTTISSGGYPPQQLFTVNGA